MNEALRIKVQNLKDLLRVFDPEKELVEFSLGDTWHPSFGYIDESIFGDDVTVKDVLDYEYEFSGLVGFVAGVGEVKIQYLDFTEEKSDYMNFLVSGSEKELRNLMSKITELNAYNPDTYIVEIARNW